MPVTELIARLVSVMSAPATALPSTTAPPVNRCSVVVPDESIALLIVMLPDEAAPSFRPIRTTPVPPTVM